MQYKLSQNITFIVLAMISALALLSQHQIVSFVFFALAIIFVNYEHKVYEYIKSA